MMRKELFFFSVFHLLITLLLLVGGGCCFALAGSEKLQAFIVYHLSGRGPFFRQLGCGLLVLGLCLVVALYRLYCGQYYTLKMSASKIRIEEAIIRDYVAKYWKEEFPQDTIEFNIVMHRAKTLEIIAKIFPIEEARLHRIQNELGVLLARKLGYEKEFLLTVERIG